MPDNILDTPIHIYDGSDDTYYHNFEVNINGEKLLVNAQRVNSIQTLWEKYPNAPSRDELCKCSSITKKTKDVGLLHKKTIARMLNVREEDVGDVQTVEVLCGTLRNAALFYAVSQGSKKYLIIFSSGETQPGRYQRLLEAAFEI